MTHPDVQLDDLASSTIMLVDDEPAVIGVLESFLEDQGYTNLVTATDSGEALSLLESSPVDLLLLDLNMPGCDGFQVMEEANRLQPDCALVVVSGETSFLSVRRALRRGACDDIRKTDRHTGKAKDTAGD